MPLKVAREYGICPSREFPPRRSAYKSSHEPRVDGILPEMLLEMFRDFRLIKLPTSSGMESVSWLCDKSSHQLNWFSLPNNPYGMDPDKILEERFNANTFLHPAKSAGMAPLK